MQEAELVDTFHVQTFPTLLGLTGENTGHPYETEFEYEKIASWVRHFSVVAPVVEFSIKELSP